ncbi:MAG: hypothetical protein KatS3mg011_0707 [Acidimicrobiia bacterium]|nr:MAG: hypothetical protein KatS3mg011_0707 [Acidimicrobiia bacterium]
MRLLRIAGLALLLVATGAAGYWAGRVALEPPANPLAEDSTPLTYVVEVGTVGRSFSFTAVAEWSLVPAGLNSAAGVVTSVEVAPGDVVGPGEVVYTVNLRPVVVAEGEVPMFRSLRLRDRGADVAQLQRLLAYLGLYSGDADGWYGTATRTAVRVWQRALGVEDTGVVEAGDLVFVPALPARIAVAEDLSVGARVGGGETAILLVPDDPVFRIPLAVEQAALVPLTGQVRVHYSGGVWDALIDRAVESPQTGQLDLFLVGADGGSVCGDDCARWVDLQGRTSFRADVIVVPDTTGPVVPVAAIGTDPANHPFVTRPDGTQVPVEIVESAQGIAVVDGIEPGTVILLPQR